MTIRSKARVLGTCYVCGRRVFGRRTVDADRGRRLAGNVVVRDAEGVRHSKCEPRRGSGLGEVLET